MWEVPGDSSSGGRHPSRGTEATVSVCLPSLHPKSPFLPSIPARCGNHVQAVFQLRLLDSVFCRDRLCHFTFVAFFSNHFGQNILLKDAVFFPPERLLGGCQRYLSALGLNCTISLYNLQSVQKRNKRSPTASAFETWGFALCLGCLGHLAIDASPSAVMRSLFFLFYWQQTLGNRNTEMPAALS